MKLGLSLHLTGEIVSRPYIDLTIHVMHGFGAEVDWTSPDTIEVQPKPYSDAPYLIENDWSASSYWYEMASLYPISEAHVALRGLEDSSRQGDSVVKYIFSLLGVKTTFDEPHTGKPTTVRLTRHLDSGTTKLRLSQLSRLGSDCCCDLLRSRCNLPLHGSCQSAHQRDGPTRGLAERTAQARIPSSDHQQ